MPEVQERLRKLGQEADGGSSAEVARLAAAEAAKWAPIVKASNFSANR
jgi:tripartite-type tricarboxylate transporter receptor subunit TctC